LIGFGVVLIGLAWARSIPPAANPESDRARYHDLSFSVVRVIDGDTLDIRATDGDKPATRIRLWGVDTPETGHGDRPAMYFGAEAADFARQILEGRKVHVVLSPRRSRDRFGRLLAYVFLERGGTMFNEQLLETGYAYADPRFDHHYEDRFEALEKEARRDSRGMWKAITLEGMPDWRRRAEQWRADRE
jgi:endonuclease YncB( thermonuclease family)